MAAPNLAQRFLELKKQVGGNREKQAFEFTFGRTPEEGMGITAPAPHIVRILSQIHYALEMQQTGACSGAAADLAAPESAGGASENAGRIEESSGPA